MTARNVRLTAATIPRRLAAGDAPTADWGEKLLRQCPWLTGIMVSATFDGADVVDVEHGLGRAYRGGWAVWTTDGESVVVESPSTAAESSGGIDTRTFVRLRSPSGGTSHSCQVWVF